MRWLPMVISTADWVNMEWRAYCGNKMQVRLFPKDFENPQVVKSERMNVTKQK
jgi:hypothetical protein